VFCRSISIAPAFMNARSGSASSAPFAACFSRRKVSASRSDLEGYAQP
jgi:hypothetical protein